MVWYGSLACYVSQVAGVANASIPLVSDRQTHLAHVRNRRMYRSQVCSKPLQVSAILTTFFEVVGSYRIICGCTAVVKLSPAHTT